MRLKWVMCTLLFIGLLAGTATSVLAAPNIIDFELEVDLKDGKKYDLEYEMNGSTVEAKYLIPGEPALYGQEAAPKVKEFMDSLALTPSSKQDTVITDVLSKFGINREDVKEFELEVDFENGAELEIEFKG
ncbi:YusW family protein [Alkalihalophilus marmarensis]|uniref:YusW family protein n=1 Tax=Alkalihalophilus marmarensis TaxID=521377 RepID=UPI002DBB87B0|nr:YusW family protein [Alkalihalophilus marmarensis]MEC2070366.1 YusW family protein [Alkalihalophilus marmarensis]